MDAKILRRKKYKADYYQKNKNRLREKRRSRTISQERLRKYALKYHYNLSIEDYEAFIVVQKGRCAICGSIFTNNNKPHVDHSHTTGQVRGLLCKKCNIGLGMFSDDMTLFQMVIKYLGGTNA